jgi:hypothetical protein
MQMEGKVFKKMIGRNSKTQYEAVCIKHNDDLIILRQPGQNPFSNPELKKLAGKKIKAEGELVRNILFLTHWEVISK